MQVIVISISEVPPKKNGGRKGKLKLRQANAREGEVGDNKLGGG